MPFANEMATSQAFRSARAVKVPETVQGAGLGGGLIDMNGQATFPVSAPVEEMPSVEVAGR